MKNWIFDIIKRAFIMLTVASTAADGRNDDATKSDGMKITVEFYAGSLSMLKYKTTIYNDGICIQEYLDDSSYEDIKNELKIDKLNMKKILETIEATKFFKLPSEIIGDGEDQPTLKITVEKGKSRHAVTVYAPNKVDNRHADDVDHFYVLWNAIHKTVSSPYDK